jgi:hypothetical protein
MSSDRLLLQRDTNDHKLLREPSQHAVVRNLSSSDALALASLMFAAYHGGVDDGGESEEDALTEVQDTFNGRYGPYFPQASFGLWQNGQLISAVIVTLFNNLPLFAFCMTDPEHKRKGNCQYLIQQSLRALREAGWHHVRLYVTAANTPALTLYRQVGFSQVMGDTLNAS